MSREPTAQVIVYADFNCLHCYLASQRADELLRSGAANIEWRAVEHNRLLPVTGAEPTGAGADWAGDMAEARQLALPGESLPAVLPTVMSNTRAAVAAYAEAIADGVQHQLRARLFESIWARGRNLSSGEEVRRVITGLLWPPEPIDPHLASPDLPGPLIHDPNVLRIVRRSGGTIALDGTPLTTAGDRRIRQWRQQWLALPAQGLPTVIGPDGAVHTGIDSLRWLAATAESVIPAAPAAPAVPSQRPAPSSGAARVGLPE